MVAKVAFEVVAEFIFEEAVALTATNKLTKAVGSLSDEVDNAIFGAGRLGLAYAKSFLTGGAGALGIFGSAIKSSEKFRSTQIELANTMLSNRFTVNGEIVEFNQALRISDNILGDINKKANAFGISPNALADQTKLFANFLAPKGLAGDNLGNASELGRVALKGVPALNIDQNNAGQQISSAIGGKLSKATLFGSRLFAEAGDAISKVTGGTIKDIKTFNQAKPDVRVKALIAGLNKLAGTSDIVNARADLLTSKLRTIADLFVGVGSILEPLGRALTRIIGPVLDEVIGQIQSKGPVLVNLATKFLNGLGESPKEMFLNLRQFANLNEDIKKSGTALRFLATSILVLGVAASIGPLNKFFLSIVRGGGFIGGFTKMLLKMSRGFQLLLGKGLIARLLLIIPTFIGLLGVFQILSRTADKMKFEFLALVDVFSGKFLKQIDRFGTIIGLITEPWSYVVEIFSDFLSQSFLLPIAFEAALFGFKKLNDGLKFFAIVVQGIFIFIKAVGAAIGALIGTLAAGIQDPKKFLDSGFNKSIGGNTAEAFNNEINKGVKSVVDRLLNPETKDKAVAKNQINVDQRNTFNIREKIEPDRIAFTLTDQIKKLSENRRTSVGRPLIPSGAS